MLQSLRIELLVKFFVLAEELGIHLFFCLLIAEETQDLIVVFPHRLDLVRILFVQ